MLLKKVKNRLSILITLSLISILTIFLTLKVLEDNVLYFYSPSEIKNSNDISNTLSKVFSNQNISSVVIGTKNIKHLEQNFKSVENKYLERKENGKF